MNLDLRLFVLFLPAGVAIAGLGTAFPEDSQIKIRFLWVPLDSFGFLCVPLGSLGFLGIPWDFLGFIGVPWGSLGFLWGSLGFLRVS